VAQPGGPPPPIEIIWFQPNPEAPTWGPSGPPVWEYDVIAGSVVQLEAPEIRDLDTYTDEGAMSAGVPLGTQVEDHTWKYRVVEGAGDIVDPDEWTGYTTSRTFTWWAPVTDGDVTFTFWARNHTPANEHWGTDNAPTSHAEYGDPVQYLTGVVHVHELEVCSLEQVPSDLYFNALYPGAPDPPHSWECDWWYSSHDALPSLRYDRDQQVEHRVMLFEGDHHCSVLVGLRGKGGWSGSVLRADLRLYAPWPEEGSNAHPGFPVALTGASNVVVDELPVVEQVHSAVEFREMPGSPLWTPTPIDYKITFDSPYTWDWPCEMHGGEYSLEGQFWEYQTTCPVDDAELDWVATSHDTILVPMGEETLKRVADVYDRFEGLQDHLLLGNKAVLWVIGDTGSGGPRLQFDLNRYWGLPDESATDVWCMFCADTLDSGGNRVPGGGDCITCAELAVEALHLVGVPARATRLYPQPARGQPGDWEWPHDCWAGHPSYLVGFCSGNHHNNNFEAAFTVDGLWWSVFPTRLAQAHPADIVTSVADHYFCGYTGVPCWCEQQGGLCSGQGHVLVTEQ